MTINIRPLEPRVNIDTKHIFETTEEISALQNICRQELTKTSLLEKSLVKSKRIIDVLMILLVVFVSILKASEFSTVSLANSMNILGHALFWFVLVYLLSGGAMFIGIMLRRLLHIEKYLNPATGQASSIIVMAIKGFGWFPRITIFIFSFFAGITYIAMFAKAFALSGLSALVIYVLFLIPIVIGAAANAAVAASDGWNSTVNKPKEYYNQVLSKLDEIKSRKLLDQNTGG